MPGQTPRNSAFARLLTGWVILLSLAIPACSSTAPVGRTTSSTAAPGYAAALRSQLEATMKVESVPGAVVYVQDPGKGTWTAALGTSDLSTNAPMSVKAHMRIGSITKTFTATVILQLAGEGKLSLDDPVAKYQPGVPNGANITIRELLNMTSGLFDYAQDQNLLKTFVGTPTRVWQPQELLQAAFQHPPAFAPGTSAAYSNTNYILLGLIAEQVGGKPLGEEFQERIFRPLGMRDTSLPALSSAAIPKPHPQGYSAEASGECPATPLPSGAQAIRAGAASSPLCNVTGADPSWGWAAGSAISTLHDLRIWAKALATGTLLSAAMQQARLAWVQLAPGVQYGLGIFNIEGFLGHNGSIPGFQSFMGYMPGADEMVIVLTNLDQSPNCTPSANPGGPPQCPLPADDMTEVISQSVFA